MVAEMHSWLSALVAEKQSLVSMSKDPAHERHGRTGSTHIPPSAWKEMRQKALEIFHGLISADHPTQTILTLCFLI